MTFQLFFGLFVIFAAIAGLLTEAVKQYMTNAQTDASKNFIAFINAGIVGGGGSVAAFLIMGIPFDVIGVVSIICMVVAVWIGSMIGYDKVMQLASQISIDKEHKEEKKAERLAEAILEKEKEEAKK